MNAYEGLAEYIYMEERRIRAGFQAHTKRDARTFHRIAGIPSFPTGSGIPGNFLLSRTYSIRDRICRPSGHLAKVGIGISGNGSGCHQGFASVDHDALPPNGLQI
jgi:hypothetical protein